MDMYIVIYAYNGILCNNEKTTVIYHSRLNLTDIMLSKKSYVQKNTRFYDSLYTKFQKQAKPNSSDKCQKRGY